MEWYVPILNDWLVMLVVCVVCIWLTSWLGKPESAPKAMKYIMVAYFTFLTMYFVFAGIVIIETLRLLGKFLGST